MRWLLFSLPVVLIGIYSYAIADELTSVTIHTDSELTLRMQLADTPEERKNGMMNKKDWGESDGMLFVMEEPFQVIMWMKNTPLPMDMLFIGEDGRVKYIHENAVPYSTDYIIGPEQTAAVIEVPAGFAQKKGIKVGHAVTFPHK